METSSPMVGRRDERRLLPCASVVVRDKSEADLRQSRLQAVMSGDHRPLAAADKDGRFEHDGHRVRYFGECTMPVNAAVGT